METQSEVVTGTGTGAMVMAGAGPDPGGQRIGNTSGKLQPGDPVPLSNSAPSRKAGLPPFFLLHGDCDRCVGPESSVEFAESLRRHGVAAECVVLPGVTHTDPILELPMEGFDLASEAVLALVLEGDLGRVQESWQQRSAVHQQEGGKTDLDSMSTEIA